MGSLRFVALFGRFFRNRFGCPIVVFSSAGIAFDTPGFGALQSHDAMGEHQLHGRSLTGLLGGDGSWDRQVHYAQYHGDWYGHYSSRMVTDGRWKLVWNLLDLCELYDLQHDPHEMTNRFYDPACRDIRHHYMTLLLAEAQRLGDGQLSPVSLLVDEQFS